MQFPTVEHNKQRILTTEQIAAFYGTTPNVITKNFNRKKDRFIEGKHYFLLEGETLQQFKAMYLQQTSPQNVTSSRETTGQNVTSSPPTEETTPQNEDSLKGVNKLYLWTEKGTLMHAKSLKTDEAWEKYDELVDGYYRRGEIIAAQQQTIATQQVSMLDEVQRLDGLLHELAAKQKRFLHDDGDLVATGVTIHRLTQSIGEMKLVIEKFKKTLSRTEYAQREDVAAMERTLKDAVYYVQRLQKTTELGMEMQERSLDIYGFAGSALEALGQLPPGETRKQLKQAKDEEW
jgi:hypothetical protein